MAPQQLKLFRCVSSGSNENTISFVESTEGLFILLKKNALLTKKQLDICLEATNSILEKNSKYHDPSAVMMMLISGRSQISDAIKDVGIDDSDSEFLVACTSDTDLERFRALNGVELVPGDTGIPDDDRKLDAYIFPKITDIIYDLRRSR